MKRWSFAIAVSAVCSLCWLTISVDAKNDNLPRLPGAMLLVGYPPYSLSVTTGNKTRKLQEDEQSDGLISPSMSADGNVVASAHRIAGDPFTRTPRLMVSTYSTTDNRWTDHEGLEILVGSVAISPAGSKLACVTRKTPKEPSHLQILDLGTRKVIVGPAMPERTGSGISWSPDGRRIAFDMEAERQMTEAATPLRRVIYVMDIDSGKVSSIADGMSPSWSPSGEWIAFVDYVPNRGGSPKYQVVLMRPAGKDSKILTTFHSDVFPNLKPVWSPDSKTLLINESRNPDKDTWNIDMLDLATLKLTKKFKNTPPVFGWAAVK